MMKIILGNIKICKSIKKMIQVKMIFKNKNRGEDSPNKNMLINMKMINMGEMSVKKFIPKRVLPYIIQKVTQKYCTNMILLCHWIYTLPSVCMYIIFKERSKNSFPSTCQYFITIYTSLLWIKYPAKSDK